MGNKQSNDLNVELNNLITVNNTTSIDSMNAITSTTDMSNITNSQQVCNVSFDGSQTNTAISGKGGFSIVSGNVLDDSKSLSLTCLNSSTIQGSMQSSIASSLVNTIDNALDNKSIQKAAVAQSSVQTQGIPSPLSQQDVNQNIKVTNKQDLSNTIRTNLSNNFLFAVKMKNYAMQSQNCVINDVISQKNTAIAGDGGVAIVSNNVLKISGNDIAECKTEQVNNFNMGSILQNSIANDATNQLTNTASQSTKTDQSSKQTSDMLNFLNGLFSSFAFIIILIVMAVLFGGSTLLHLFTGSESSDKSN